jgi:hypothetical protein
VFCKNSLPVKKGFSGNDYETNLNAHAQEEFPKLAEMLAKK